MDPTASSRRPPDGWTRDQPIIAERGDEPGTIPGESEKASGRHLPVKTPPQGNGPRSEAGCRLHRRPARRETGGDSRAAPERTDPASRSGIDRKSTRLNSSHLGISYAVFCLK